MKKKKNKFPETKLIFAYVLHANLTDIQKVNEFLDSLEDLRVVYQKCSADRLYITEEKEAEE